ncbi:hypothetical protein [Methanobrevibacter ruminantium]|uniref:hypothetical protein n=1 Tax=Methanobrevibacter ruminantium TaxID=83816 RepID=UPI0026ED4767|nr:hypothetical protein [Methanobrevibacter ruminantium]
MTEENNPNENGLNENGLRKKLLQRLEVEVGLPLIPKSAKELERNFNGSEILLSYFPVREVKELKIDGNVIDLEKVILLEDEGTIHLPHDYSADVVYVEYTYGLPPESFLPILDLMEEYELDSDWKKDVSSVKEINVSVSYDTSLSKGATIQKMIADLSNRYSCLVRMI